MKRKNSFIQFLHENNEQMTKINYTKEEMNGREVIRFHDGFGGYGFLDIKDGIANIIDWHSVPFNKMYTSDEDSFKRRGFSFRVITDLIKKQLNIDTFRVSMQSSDTRNALKRLIEKGVITPVEGYELGISTDRYPTMFKIN